MSQKFIKALNKLLNIIIFLLPAVVFFSFSSTGSENISAGSSLPDKKQEKSRNINTFGYYWIIYDSECPYCKQAMQYIKQLDWEGRFKFISYREPLTYEMFPMLNPDSCKENVHMVTQKGEILKGYEVFRNVIDNLSATKILNPLLHNDFAEKKLNEIYQKMVEERSCFYKEKQGQSCDLQEKQNSVNH